MELETRLLLDITLLLVVAAVFSILFARFRMPTIVGYLAAGILLGSSLLPGVAIDEGTVSVFSSLGIVLLMFFIGIELNLRGLRRLGPSAFLIVTLEMSLMIMVGYYLGRGFGLDPTQALFLGAIMSGASTAAVLSVAAVNPHMKGDLSKRIMSIMIFEDIVQVVILTLASPLALGAGLDVDLTSWIILEIIAFMGLSILLGLAVVPRGMDWLRRNYTKETVLIVSLALCFAMALFSSYIGLSVAIGAFLAGIILAESSCNQIVRHRIEPMKELFMAIFFIAIGLQIDLSSMVDNIALVIVIAAVFIAAKFTTVMASTYLTTIDLRSSFYLATSLVAMSEFGFIVATIALNAGIITSSFYSVIIGAALITMVVLPLLSRSGPRLFDRSARSAPPWLTDRLRRMDKVRREVRRKLSISPELRLEVRKQVIMILMDFLIIITALLVLNLVPAVDELIGPVAQELGLSLSLLKFLITLAFVAPAVLNLITRVQLISMTVALSISEGGRHSRGGRLKIYRAFRDIGEVLIGLLLVLVLLPFFPPLELRDATSVGAVAVAVVLLTIVSWGLFRPAMNKMSSALMTRLAFLDEEESPPPARESACED